jgi:hypothetical protein
MVGVLAMFTLGAFASSSASAVRFVELECEKPATELQGTKYETQAKCEKEEETSSTGKWQHKTVLGAVGGTSGVSKLEGELGSGNTKVTIECKKDVFTGTLEAGGANSGEVIFKECSLIGASGCTVPNIEFHFLSQLVRNGTSIEEEFKPTAEKAPVFVEFEITGSLCALKNKYKVEGTQKCALPSQSKWLVLRFIECTPAGSKLTFGTKPAKFTSTESLETTTKREWSVE